MKVLVTSFLLITAQGLASLSMACVPPAYQRVAAEYGLPADIVYAVSLAESGRTTPRYGFGVWPWALNIGETAHYPLSQSDAHERIVEALAQGDEGIAIGLMQVYWQFHKELFRDQAAYALDLGANLRAGAKILREFADQANDIWTAVGYYHAGTGDSARTQRLAKQYVDRVRQIHQRHVISACRGRSSQ